MYPDDNTQDSQYRLERTVSQAVIDIANLAAVVKANESALGDFKERVRNQRLTIKSLCERVNALEIKKNEEMAIPEGLRWVKKRVLALEEKALPVQFVDGAKDKIEALDEAMVEVKEGLMEVEERGDKVGTTLDLHARRISVLEEMGLPAEGKFRSQPPYLLYHSPTRTEPHIAQTNDISHARGLAHAYANAKDVAIRVRDGNGLLLFEAKPGEKEGS